MSVVPVIPLSRGPQVLPPSSEASTEPSLTPTKIVELWGSMSSAWMCLSVSQRSATCHFAPSPSRLSWTMPSLVPTSTSFDGAEEEKTVSPPGERAMAMVVSFPVLRIRSMLRGPYWKIHEFRMMPASIAGYHVARSDSVHVF